MAHNDQKKNVQTARPLFRMRQILWYIIGIAEGLLFIRFLLLLLGANTGATFSQFILGVTRPLVTPFTYVFNTQSVLESTFEWTTLLAMVVYWLVGIALVRLIYILRPVSSVEADRKLENEDV